MAALQAEMLKLKKRRKKKRRRKKKPTLVAVWICLEEMTVATIRLSLLIKIKKVANVVLVLLLSL